MEKKSVYKLFVFNQQITHFLPPPLLSTPQPPEQIMYIYKLCVLNQLNKSVSWLGTRHSISTGFTQERVEQLQINVLTYTTTHEENEQNFRCRR